MLHKRQVQTKPVPLIFLTLQFVPKHWSRAEWFGVSWRSIAGCVRCREAENVELGSWAEWIIGGALKGGGVRMECVVSLGELVGVVTACCSVAVVVG